MCLLAKEFEKIAEKDVVCYKELRKYDVFGIVVTPIKRRWIGRRVLNGRRLYKARGREDVCYDSFAEAAVVSGGFVHSYAIRDLLIPADGYVCYKCIIPAGTKYWVSHNGTEYASKSLRFVEKLG